MADPVLQLLSAFRPGAMLGDRRFTETVNVKAPSPAQSQTDPQELIDIVLGSETSPPKGMYLSPELRDPAKRAARLGRSKVNPNYPNIAKAWEGVKSRYPYAAATVDRVMVLPKIADKHIAGTALSLPYDTEYLGIAPGLEAEHPETIMDTLVHELAHVSQYQNFPDFAARRASTKPTKAYLERPHEQQAYDIEFARREADNRRRMILNSLKK